MQLFLLLCRYIAALNRVLDDKKEFYAAKEVAEKTRRERDRDQFLQQIQESHSGGLGLGHSSTEALLFGRSGAEPEQAVGQRHQRDQQAQRLAGYDFRRDVNVLSHPRYASAVKALCSQSDHPFAPLHSYNTNPSHTNNKGRAVLIKSHGGTASVESSEGSEKYKLFRGRNS